ncbi:hypothetical protein, partial [Stenotrophomonas maltophilia]|uniref:hypothetical protein n=1 Tax=Stenotrophomonas maltophilia TaxID=40324 RepID=UPI001F2EB04F
EELGLMRGRDGGGEPCIVLLHRNSSSHAEGKSAFDPWGCGKPGTGSVRKQVRRIVVGVLHVMTTWTSA